MALKKKSAGKKKIPAKKILAAKKRPALKKKPAPKKKRPVAKKKSPAAKKPAPPKNMVGTIIHYFPHVQAAVIKVKAPIACGDTIKIKGHTTDLTQIVASMEIDRAPITLAKKGQEIGVLVSGRVREHDIVTKE